MKKSSRLIHISLIASLFFVFAFAIAPSGQAFQFSYFTCFQLQNLSVSTANVSIDYYNQAGSVVSTVSDTIAGSSSTTYCPIAPASPFNGSVVVSSDQSLAAVTNVLGDLGVASAAYVGSGSGATQVNLPLLMKGNGDFNTWVNVQNAGGASASVTIDYSDGSSASGTIPVGASATFDQSAETHTLAVFAGTITSDQPVVATVVEEDTAIMFAYSGFNSAATDPVMPLINYVSGYITGVQIQNTGGSSTDVTVSYTPSALGTACTETQTIPAGESKTFALWAFYLPPTPEVTTDCTTGEQFVGSASVTANSASQDLVVVVNQLSPGLNGEAYGGFDPSTATDTVVLPLIMDDNVGWFTGFNIMNVGSSSTTVNCTFTGTSYTASATLAAGEAFTDVQLGAITSGYVGSATCTAGSGGQILGVVNEVGTTSGDEFMVYEGITVP